MLYWRRFLHKLIIHLGVLLQNNIRIPTKLTLLKSKYLWPKQLFWKTFGQRAKLLIYSPSCGTIHLIVGPIVGISHTWYLHQLPFLFGNDPLAPQEICYCLYWKMLQDCLGEPSWELHHRVLTEAINSLAIQVLCCGASETYWSS